MSIKWMATVWEDATDVDGTELLVLLAIADHAGDDGVAWPSVARLCKRARRAERTVQEALTTLETKGWLGRSFRPGQSTLYQMLTPAANRTPADSAPPQQIAGVPPGELRGTPQGDRTQNRKRITSESGGVVPEVPTEDAPQQRSMIEQPFPAFAKAALGSVTEQQAGEWSAAWRTAHAVGREWDPLGNLTKYLARCKERKTAPSPTEWTRWFAEDEHKARQFAREAAASATEETPHQWWE